MRLSPGRKVKRFNENKPVSLFHSLASRGAKGQKKRKGGEKIMPSTSSKREAYL